MNQLMNFLQSASNTAASNVSGPVDLIAAALRAAGVPVPRNALLSSEWMREKGLTAPVQQGASQVAGDTLGLLAPVAAAAKAPQIARGLLQMGENAAAPRVINRGGAARQRGIFMGDLSKTWDSAAAAKAEAMEKAGKDARTIWNETGTFRGVDGKWRQEIDDSVATLNRSYTSNPDHFIDLIDEAIGRDSGVPLGNALKHDQAFKAYPQTTALRFKVDGRPGGSFDGKTIYAADPFAAKAGSPDAIPESTVLHELQHAIQERQGFARGGSPVTLVSDSIAQFERAGGWPAWNSGVRTPELVAAKEFADKVNTGPGGMFGAYQRLAGEAEARAVQSRMNLTPAQRRALFPLDSYDVPINELIVR